MVAYLDIAHLFSGKKRPRNEGKVRICYYQDKCKYSAEECQYLHLDAEKLKGKKKPYKPCSFHPNCSKEECRFVHIEANETKPKKKKKENMDS